MKCELILFSPTGGTEKAATMLCSAISQDINITDLTKNDIKKTSFENDGDTVAVIAVPSYGGRVPALATERLKMLNSDKMPCVLLCVYGNRAYEDTLAEEEDIAKECGFSVIAAVAAVAEHSIIHEYAKGRPDKTDEENLNKIGKKIAEKLSSGDTSKPAIPGNRPYKKGGAVLAPKTEASCTHCGICAENCPSGAINKETIKTDAKKCIGCMRCVVKCPVGARKINGAMVSVATLAIKKACSVRKECELYI